MSNNPEAGKSAGQNAEKKKRLKEYARNLPSPSWGYPSITSQLDLI